jgi:hypothetical protein
MIRSYRFSGHEIILAVAIVKARLVVDAAVHLGEEVADSSMSGFRSTTSSEATSSDASTEPAVMPARTRRRQHLRLLGFVHQTGRMPRS